MERGRSKAPGAQWVKLNENIFTTAELFRLLCKYTLHENTHYKLLDPFPLKILGPWSVVACVWGNTVCWIVSMRVFALFCLLPCSCHQGYLFHTITATRILDMWGWWGRNRDPSPEKYWPSFPWYHKVIRLAKNFFQVFRKILQNSLNEPFGQLNINRP